MNTKTGFTLIELLTAVVIISILTAIAVPLYTAYIQKSRRADGLNSLSAMSLAEERYRTTNTQYGTLAQVWAGVTTSEQGFYTLSISNVSATTYTLVAQAIGSQANDSQDGTACATLQFALSSGVITKTPTACWPQ